jgi:hypothetical protein
MGALKTLMGMVILLAIVVFGYWLYATYTSATTNDRIWAQINENMPDQLRRWSCEQMNARLKEEEPPASCADIWQTAIAPNIDAEPVLESNAGASGAPQDTVEETRAATPAGNAQTSSGTFSDY